MDKHDPEFWQSLKPEDVVTLSDPQTLNLLIEQGGDVSHGLDFSIARVLSITEASESVLWLLFEIESRDCDLILMAKIIDGELALRVYYEPDDFEPGTRAALLESGCAWLFDTDRAPEGASEAGEWSGQDTAAVGGLEYARQVIQDLDDGRQIHFRMKPQGPLYGTCVEDPKPGRQEETLVAVVEYDTDQECDDPELLVLEFGDNPEGGLIRLLQGCEVNFNDVELIRGER